MKWEELNYRMINDDWGIPRLVNEILQVNKGRENTVLTFRRRLLSRLNVVRAYKERRLMIHGTVAQLLAWKDLMDRLNVLLEEVECE